MSVAFNKFDQFVQDLTHKVHDLSADQLVLALSNSAPTASNSILSDITEISYTNLSSRNVSTTSCTQTSGTLKLILANTVLTASGPVATFRYIVLYNSTPTSPLKPLLGFYDYGSSVTLASGDTFTVSYDQTSGAISLT